MNTYYNIDEILKGETEIVKRTELFHNWMKNSDDSIKMRYALNWKLPHSLFNVSVKIFGDATKIQNINFYEIFKSRNLGNWSSNNSKVITQ